MVKFSRYDSVDYLDSDEAIANYLGAAMERGDGAHICRCLAKATKARAVNQLARETGIDRSALCKMFSEGDVGTEAPLTADAIEKVARAFAVSARA